MVANHTVFTVLVVDTVPQQIRQLIGILHEQGCHVLVATDHHTALNLATMQYPHLVLINAQMPGGDSMGLCQEMRSQLGVADVPIILINGPDTSLDITTAFDYGAIDVIGHPLRAEEVIARTQIHLRIRQMANQFENQLREELSRYEIQVRQHQETLSHATHDLKNPLTNIRLYAELLKDHGHITGEEGEDYVERIEYYANQMLSIISSLLSLNRLQGSEQLHKTRVPLADYLQRALDDFLLMMQHKQLSWEITVTPPDLVGYLDEAEFKSVVHNLVSNAVKYARPDGYVHIAAHQAESETIITVADNGLGIPSHVQDKIFSAFFRVDTQQHRHIEGAGLGLAIVQAVVKRHGGGIRVESTLDAGSRFIISLPAPPS